MDTKRLMLGLAVSMLVVIGWTNLVNYLAQKNPQWAATQPAAQPTSDNPVNVEQPAGTTTPASTQFGQPAPTTAGSALRLIAATQPAHAVLGSPKRHAAEFTMSVALDPRGAGISNIVLNDFKASVEKPDLYSFQEPYNGGTHHDTRSMATRSVTIDGVTIDLLRTPWQLIEQSPTRAVYRATIERAGGNVLIDKVFELPPRSTDVNGPQGYEVSVSHVIRNAGASPITAQLEINGPTAPPREADALDDRQIIGGYLNEAGFVSVYNWPINHVNKDKLTDSLTTNENQPIMWVGMSSVYFNAIYRPDLNKPIRLENVQVVAINPDTPADNKTVVDGVRLLPHAAIRIRTNAVAVPAGGVMESAAQIFVGPRQRSLLRSAYYEQPRTRYDETLVMTSGPCAWCTWTWMVNGLYALLSFFYMIFRDWGLAIIALVFLVRALLHPITKRAQINMSKMGKMGPEIERLKKKHGDNKDELNKAMMQFYKQQGATPILGCLPMFLQMPIWIALYSSLQSTFELRQSPFLWGFTWIQDLAHPDRLIYFPHAPINLYFFKIDALNLLPLLLGVVSWFQAKIMRLQQPPATTPEQAQQQKMMQWMSLLLPVFLYNGPSGLNIYIITSSVLGLIESQIVRKHIKEREALEAQGAVIIDAPADKDRPATGSVRRKQEKDDPTPKAGGFMGWLSELQKKAEEMQKEQQKRKKRE